MFHTLDDKPIVACSTGLESNTAIGLIRLSGFPDLSYLKDFFKIDVTKLKPRVATFCKLYFNDQILDEVVITFFENPNSYNGENVLEISAHGNKFNLKRIIDSFISSKLFRLAGNGEFTFRALKNKKLTLSQIEGLDSLLNASSSLMLDQGLDLLNGKLYGKYKLLRETYLKLKSSIEINIDFAEDVGEEQSKKLLDDAVKEVGDQISNLYKSTQINSKVLLSPDVVLVGEPNAGKSSLFNMLLNDSRSIVSDIAGTTRDFITEYISVDNNSFRLIDTAGLRNTTDVIEEEGIKRSVNLLTESFFKILLVNISEAQNFDFDAVKDTEFDVILFSHLDDLKVDFQISQLISKLPRAHKYYGVVTNIDNNNCGPIGAFLNSGSIEPVFSGPIGADFIFGPMGANAESGSMGADSESFNGSIGPGYASKLLKLCISECLTQDISSKYQELRSSDPIIIERHRHKIVEIKDSFDTFSNNINSLGDIGIISAEARILENKISELIGITTSDDVLNNIFSNFCIGK